MKRTIEPVPSPDSAEVLEYICSYSNDSMELYEDIGSYEELYEKADLIAEVTADGEAMNRARSVVRKCSVINVIKGEASDDIYVFEPNYIVHDTYDSILVYMPMQKGHKYILFLRGVDAGKSGNPEFGRGYWFYSPLYGKHEKGVYAVPCGEEIHPFDTRFVYGDIKGWAIFENDATTIERYNSIHDAVFE